MNTMSQKIAKTDIYKVHILAKRIIVVFGKHTTNPNEVFSANELAEIQQREIRVIYSGAQLYLDDNIHTIKTKIVHELDNVAYSEMYLFCRVPNKKVDFTDIRKEMESVSGDLYDQATQQLLQNYGIINKPLDETRVSDDIENTFLNQAMIKSIPVGTFYGENAPHLFPGNPYHMVANGVGMFPEDSPVIVMDNHLLLNYHFGRIHDNTLYVCLLEDVLDYGETIGINETYLLRTYYPLLYKDGIKKSGDWLSKKQFYIQKNDNKNALLYQKSIDVFYDIYYGQGSRRIEYLSRGITNITFKIKSGLNAFIPLESIFKTIHATKNIPFIKWNPGTRRENVYRLYTETRTNDGKHIPYLPENVVMKLSKELGKSKQIATHIVVDNYTFQMSIEQNGDILLSTTLKSPLMVHELTQVLKTHVNNIIHNVNGFLSQVGYNIPIFESFYDDNVEVINMNYTMETRLNNDFKLDKYMGCISSVFDETENEKKDKSGIQWLFKRVENYREMDAQTRFITDVFKTNDDMGDVIQLVSQKYGMSEEDAKNTIIAYLSTHENVRGKIIDNHGFPVVIKESFFDKILKIEVNDILSVAYLDTLSVYFDTMIRITQYPDTLSIPKKELQAICTQVKKIDVKPQVANVVSTAAVKIAPIPIRHAATMDDDGPIFYADDEDEEDAGPIFYDEEYEGGATDTDSAESTPESNLNPQALVGESLTSPSLFFKKMKALEPELFVSEIPGKFLGYSRLCQSAKKRQPIILTEEEKKKIDEDSRGSYTEALKYGTNPDKPYYYICPRYWCLLNNKSMTEEDVIAGKCSNKGGPDKIIPHNAKTVPKDAFVYEFFNPIQHSGKKGEYHMGYPGFLVEKTPDGKPMPCCFKTSKKNWKYLQGEGANDDDDDDEDEDDETKVKTKPKPKKRATQPDATGYIISNDTFPIRQVNRFGFLPLIIQHFLQLDNNQCVTENNAAIIKPNTTCVLRASVEQTLTQSIMGCFADLYANSRNMQETPTIEQFKQILKQQVSIDKYIHYNNGDLVSVFKPSTIDLAKLDISKYETSAFYQSLDLGDDQQMDFLEDTIASYENFMEYITNDKSSIDHTYLWDMMVDDNPNLVRGGVNLVILEMVENDITGNIRVLCPTNSRNALYDPAKKTYILVKRDVFYEPLCIYKDVNGQIYKSVLFLEHAVMAPIQRVLRIIEKMTNKYCAPLPSLPKIYKFKKNIPALTLYNKLKLMNHRVLYQVFNYQYKTIAMVAKTKTNKHIYIPCEPSVLIDGVEKRIIDDDEDNMWNDYYTTVDELQKIAKEGIPCSPKMKVVDEGLIVGVLTETNQFVQVDPPIENVAVNDGLQVMYSSNYNIADKIITSKAKVDDERAKTISYIQLESQFYSLFRTIVRDALNQYESRNMKQQMTRIMEDSKMPYYSKIREISAMVRTLVGDKIVFNDFDDEVLMEFGDLICSKEIPSQYCVVKENKATLVIPKRHLLTDKDNEVIYFGRIADELLRYKRIRLFMMNDKNYLNITNNEYKMNDDEFILIQTSINNDYLKNLVPMNISNEIKNTNFAYSQPQVSQKYSTQRVPLAEQMPENEGVAKNALQEGTTYCIHEIVEVIGNPQQSMWKRIFPKVAKEIKFKNTTENCSFYALIAAFEMHKNVPLSVNSLKIALWNAYQPYMEKYSKQIMKLLKIQGKQKIVAGIDKKEFTLETAIMSPEYYISDLDVIMFAKHANMQICLFNSNGLRSLNKKNVQWYICGKNHKDTHYFIRSPTLNGNNRIGEYHLIDRGFHLNELGEFQKTVQDSLLGFINESNLSSPESVETLEALLSRF